MTFLSKLDVVNDMLGLLGENPLNTLDEDHDLVANALRVLRTANYREQAKSWWFNKELLRLTPDADSGFIYLPTDTIRVDPSNTNLNYVARGRRLFKPFAPPLESKYVFTQPVDCWLVRLLDFEDLPISAQMFVSASAQYSFQLTVDGDSNKTQELKIAYQQALVTINSEHIRNSDVNLLRRPSTISTLGQVGLRANPGGYMII